MGHKAATRQATARRVRAQRISAPERRELLLQAAEEVFASHGYGLTDLRAFDAFPMTHHVECVGLLAAAR